MLLPVICCPSLSVFQPFNALLLSVVSIFRLLYEVAPLEQYAIKTLELFVSPQLFTEIIKSTVRFVSFI